MAKVKNYKAWSLVEYDNVQLVVIPQVDNKPSCLGCYFSNAVQKLIGKGEFSCYIHKMLCTASKRKDRQHVIFRPYGNISKQ